MTNKSANNRSRNSLVFGFSPQAELWNGRMAMIGFISLILLELIAHQGILHLWNIL
ncbi:MAG: chlorophyll a/b-binding protein [Cyanobacteria bacterium P01_F01_bin.42]